MKPKSAAIVTVFKASDMTPRGRKSVESWLRKQARWVESRADRLAPRYTARYLYR